MKAHTLLGLIYLSFLAPQLFAQTNGSTSPVIPEEARRHFVMGTTLFKDAKTADDFAQVVSEFKQAADLAPQLKRGPHRTRFTFSKPSRVKWRPPQRSAMT